jgi:hypothetical protein
MRKSSNFYEPLTSELLERRTQDWRQLLSLFFAGVIVFMALETQSQYQRIDRGIGDYVLEAISAVAIWYVLTVFLSKVLILPRWHRFELYPNEVILARKGSQSIVIRTTKEIRRRALDGCSNILVVKTEPWIKRPLECMVGKHKTTFLLSLKVVNSDVETLEKWVNFSESEIQREFRNGAKELASQLGVGRALESPHEFAQILTECLNRRLFSIIGVQIEVGLTAEQEDLRRNAAESFFG